MVVVMETAIKVTVAVEYVLHKPRIFRFATLATTFKAQLRIPKFLPLIFLGPAELRDNLAKFVHFEN
mgnify:CR=1 FL=1